MSESVPKRWFGILLGLVVSGGAGHFYLGLPRRALVWLGLQVGSLLLLAALTVLLGGSVLPYFGLLVFSGGAWLGQVVDLCVIARGRFVRTSLLRTVAFVVVSMATFRGTQLLARAYVVEAFKIPSAGMEPTLLAGDHIVVDKTAGGSKANLPMRGEPIVFEYPDPDPEHERVDFTKRVIGLPGDRIEVLGGHPVINGWRVPSCLVGTLALPAVDSSSVDGELHVEFLGNHAYLTWYESTYEIDEEGPYVVSAGQVFVLGDNRWNSSDSRSWNYGSGAGVPVENIAGRAVSVWLAFDPKGALRWDRMGIMLGDPPKLPGASDEITRGIERCLSNPRKGTLPPG